MDHFLKMIIYHNNYIKISENKLDYYLYFPFENEFEITCMTTLNDYKGGSFLIKNLIHNNELIVPNEEMPPTIFISNNLKNILRRVIKFRCGAFA